LQRLCVNYWYNFLHLSTFHPSALLIEFPLEVGLIIWVFRWRHVNWNLLLIVFTMPLFFLSRQQSCCLIVVLTLAWSSFH
jgi:hypothetical protein